MNILGLNAYHGDSSAAIVSGGQLVAAAEEERFNRVKHWAGLPIEAARYCLNGCGVDHVAISRDPRAHLIGKLVFAALRPRQWHRAASRAGNAIRVSAVKQDLQSAGLIGSAVRLHHVEHHRAHLASAFFASPFEEAAVASLDGFGDFTSAMWGAGAGNHFEVRGSTRFPHSLGLFYTAFTQFLGFPKYGDEYKMMGLAAYGEPRFLERVRDVVRTENGRTMLDLGYFTHHTDGVEMSWSGGEPVAGPVFSQKMIELFGPPRRPRSEIEPWHADLAASVQAVFEENYFSFLRFVHRETGRKALCLAGGVALNCAANGKLSEETPFSDVYIQAAAHDAGTSIGAALYVWHHVLGHPRSFVMRHVYFGPEYTDAENLRELDGCGFRYEKLDEDALLRRTAAEIAEGKIVGWFQGRMEFGPRALGNRSILADPRRAGMKDALNRRIKYREPFRPFCPSILAEATPEYFETGYSSPFMIAAYRVRSERGACIPAVVHADGTGRLQTVEKDVNPLYWKLIARFGELTGVPVLLNTSFNENEPIVNTPAEALDCFRRTYMDVLVLGPYFVSKSNRGAGAEAEARFEGSPV